MLVCKLTLAELSARKLHFGQVFGGVVGDLRIVVRRRLGRIAPAWDRLQESAELPTPFLRSFWLDAVADPNSYFLCAFDGENLVGGIPLREEKRFAVPVVRFVGHALSPDHMDLLAARGREQDVCALFREWFSRDGARVFDFDGVTENPMLHSVLPGQVREDYQARSLYLYPPSDIESITKTWSSRRRYEMERSLRRTEETGARYGQFSPYEAEEAVRVLVELHLDQFPHSGLRPNLEAAERAMRAGVTHDEMRVLAIRAADGEPVAATIIFTVNNRVSTYQLGRRVERQWRDLGKALMYYTVRWACESGFEELDLLRGASRVKTLWGEHERPLYRMRAQHGNAARIAEVANRVRARVARKKVKAA